MQTNRFKQYKKSSKTYKIDTTYYVLKIIWKYGIGLIALSLYTSKVTPPVLKKSTVIKVQKTRQRQYNVYSDHLCK